MQVMLDAATRLVVAAGQPQSGNRNDCIACSASEWCLRPAGWTASGQSGCGSFAFRDGVVV